jgi:hypothetical protein
MPGSSSWPHTEVACVSSLPGVLAAVAGSIEQAVTGAKLIVIYRHAPAVLDGQIRSLIYDTSGCP